jgi:hypothetical protein
MYVRYWFKLFSVVVNYGDNSDIAPRNAQKKKSLSDERSLMATALILGMSEDSALASLKHSLY